MTRYKKTMAEAIAEVWANDIQLDEGKMKTIATMFAGGSSPEEIDVEIETYSLPSCCYSCDSELTILATGGVSPYSYSIDNLIFQYDLKYLQYLSTFLSLHQKLS